MFSCCCRPQAINASFGYTAVVSSSAVDDVRSVGCVVRCYHFQAIEDSVVWFVAVSSVLVATMPVVVVVVDAISVDCVVVVRNLLTPLLWILQHFLTFGGVDCWM